MVELKKASTPRVEEYLESIFKLQENHKSVRITHLAEDLQISVPSVSEMIKKLAQNDFVYVEGKEVYFTKKGRALGARIVRRHRLAERLLTDILGFDWEQVHEEACRLEHAMSTELEERIADRLKNPETCPHGHPIPDANGDTLAKASRPLSELEPGSKVVVVSVPEENPELLHFLSSLGIRPMTAIEIEKTDPFGGPIHLKVGGRKQTLGQEAASEIMVAQKS